MTISSSDTAPLAIDALTVAAIAVVVYAAVNVLHEGGGHGVACVLVGGNPRVLNAVFFDCDESAISDLSARIVSAAGSAVNVLAGFIGAALFSRVRSPRARYALWLFVLINFIMAAGYLMFSGLGGFGDWERVARGIGPPGLLRGVMALVGAGLYFRVIPARWLGRLEPFSGRGPEQRGRIARLSVLPYLVGGTTFVAAGLLNPYGLELVMLSAVAASFGGTSLLFWYPLQVFQRGGPVAPTAGIARSRAWIAVALVTLLVFVLVLGPGVPRGVAVK